VHVKRASESSGYFTLEIPALAGARPYARGGELVVHIGLDVVLARLRQRGDKREAGCLVGFWGQAGEGGPAMFRNRV